jgi:hypothetical protein
LENYQVKRIELSKIFIFAALMIVLFIPVVSAVYVINDPNDPYDPDSCPFNAASGEEIAYLTPYDSSQGIQGITINTDNPLTIGQYIRDYYPEVWNKLSSTNQENYNTLWAVWPVGASTPALPTTVKNLLATNQVRTDNLNTEGLSISTMSGSFSTVQASGTSLTFSSGDLLRAISPYQGNSNNLATIRNFMV